MKVRATKRGFYKGLREVGEVFETNRFHPEWQECLEPGKKSKAEPKPEPKPDDSNKETI